MGIKPSSAIKFFFAVLIFFCLPGFLHAQDGGVSVRRFIQRLVWDADDNVLHYEVVIEREEAGGSYRRLLREITEKLYIEVSLPPGRYRYRVIPYDLLNRPVQDSQWSNFEVLPAIRPELNGYSPESFKMDEKTEYVLNIAGRNLDPKAEIYLRSPSNAQVLTPHEITILHDGNNARLLFTNDQLIPGFYEIHVRNPGGLEANLGGFFIGNFIPSSTSQDFVDARYDLFYIYLGAAWIPLIQLPHPNQFDSGGMACFGIISSMQSLFNVGLEGIVSVYSFMTYSDDQNGQQQHQSSAPLLLFEGNFLIQKQIFNRTMAFTFRAGVGVTLPTDNTDQKTHYPVDEKTIYANTGISFLYFFLKRFYVETSVNYTCVLAADNPIHSLRPWVGAGVKF